MNWYDVWREDSETRDVHATAIEAHDHEHAVEIWAHDADRLSADYAIVGGRVEPIVCVALRREQTDVRRFRVRGESVPSYSATEVKP